MNCPTRFVPLKCRMNARISQSLQKKGQENLWGAFLLSPPSAFQVINASFKRPKLYFTVSHSQGNEIAEFIKASLGNELIWYQHALIGQWLLSAVANFLPDIRPTCPSNQTLALIAGWIKHELYVQGGPRIKTCSNPKQADMLLTVRGPFHIIIPMKSLLLEFDFALSCSGNLKMLSQQAPTCAGSWNFLCSPPLPGNFCCGLHFGDMGLVIRAPAWHWQKGNLKFCHLCTK